MSRRGSALRLPSLQAGDSLDAVIAGINKMSTALSHDLESLVLYQSVSTPAQLTAAQNNYLISSARVVRMSSDASRTITGFRGGVPNQELTLINVGAQNIVLSHQDGASVAANRFLLEAGANLTLAANDSVTLYYDQATARWRNYALPLTAFAGSITYAQLPTGNGSWDTGAGTTITVTRALTVSGLLTATGKIASPLTIGTGAGAITLTEGTNASVNIGGDSIISRVTGAGFLLNQLVNVSGLLTASAGVNVPTGQTYQFNAVQVVSARVTGYTAFTGTNTNRGTAYDTATITLIQLAERVRALQVDLTAHGLIGT